MTSENITKVMITVDTEHSIGGAFNNPLLKPVGNGKRIYGRIGGIEYGIPLIMDIADRYRIPLTFFVEVFNKYYFGEKETRDVCEYILKRGHDVQLHLHPCWLNFKSGDPNSKKYSDHMSSYNFEIQTEMIGEGKELLSRYCGKPPVAFRAGNYGADANTLKAVKANGMDIDSSYNAAFPNHSKNITRGSINDAVDIHGTLELPITNFIEAIPLLGKRYKPMDLNGVSYREIQTVLEQSCVGQGPKHITLILHSFSFLKSKDVQYENCTFRHYVVKRFENLCQYLDEHKDTMNSQIMGQLVLTNNLDNNMSGSSHFCQRMPLSLSLLRAIEQKVHEVENR